MDDKPDQHKLRRFALAIGLILFTYAIAGVRVGREISPLGLRLTIESPHLIGTGLLIASLYASVRYWFYAIKATVSPIRARRMLRNHEMPPSLEKRAIETLTPSILGTRLGFPIETRSPNLMDKLLYAVSEQASKLDHDLTTTVGELFPGMPFLEFRKDSDPPGHLRVYDLQRNTYCKGVYSVHDLNKQPAFLTLRIENVGFPRRSHPILVWHSIDYILPLLVNGMAILTYLLPWRPVLCYSGLV